MADVYSIANWDANFENNRTRELKKLAWVPIPNRMDGSSYRELVEHPNGAAHFGVWIGLVEIASTCDPRGQSRRNRFAGRRWWCLIRLQASRWWRGRWA